MSLLKNYVISVRNSHTRREHIIQEFGKQNVSFEFFDAIIPEQVESLSKKININIDGVPLTKGELGCLFSHLSLWQKMIDENIEYMAIFEDDVHLGNNAHQFLTSCDWITQEFKLIKLEMFYDTLMLGKKYNIIGRKVCELKQANLGTAGYIIHKEMAKVLLEYTQNTFKKQAIPIDHIMFDIFLSNQTYKVYQLEPALCIQSDRLDKNTALGSDLEKGRTELRGYLKKEKAKLSFLQKFVRELKRIFRNVHYFIFSSKVSFK